MILTQITQLNGLKSDAKNANTKYQQESPNNKEKTNIKSNLFIVILCLIYNLFY